MIKKSSVSISAIWRPILSVVIPIILLPLPLLTETKEALCGYVVLWMALYWMLEPVPIAVTALLPVVAFPLLGILTTSETCSPYMKDTIMMYVGGLTLAAAVEHCNLHKRIALRVLLTIGTGARWLMLGFMITTMFLSMWISNTATTAMMVPIVDAVLGELHKEEEHVLIRDSTISVKPTNYSSTSCGIPLTIPNEFWKTEASKHQYAVNVVGKDATPKHDYKKLRNALLLSIAYSANCGGTGTVIGSGPNLVLKGLMEETYPNSTELTFATWLMYNTPGMILCVLVTWILLQLFYLPCWSKDDETSQTATRNVILQSYKELGSMTFHECAVLTLFLILIILWLLRDPQFIPGWASMFPNSRGIRDATPAIGICLLLFVIPSKPSLSKPSPPLLDWKTAQRKISWGVLLVLGSGFAVSDAAKKSHLSAWLGHQLSNLRFLSPNTIVIVLTFMTSALTEVISNMSMATIMLPVISQMAEAIQVHPLFLMLPVTIGCSFAMMLPVGNPSNALAFEASTLSTYEMMKPGIVLKIICCGIELLMIETLGVGIFDLKTFPAWARDNQTSPFVDGHFTTSWEVDFSNVTDLNFTIPSLI